MTAPDEKTHFKITRAEMESPNGLEAKVEQVTEGSSYRVLVTIRPGTLPRRVAGNQPFPLQGRVRIFTDNPAVGIISVPLNAVVKGPVAVYPDGYYAVRNWSGGTNRGAPQGVPLPMSVSVQVTPDSEAAKGFKITGVDVPRETITSEITPDGNGGYNVKLNNLVPTDDLNGADVRLKTDLKDTPVVRVPILVRDRAGS